MTVEGLMPVRGPSYSSEAGIRAFRSGSGGRRKALLIGTSLLVYAAFPSAALAQEECGPPPAGGGTVSCPPSLNPYPNGITYNNIVDDLTIVLEPTVEAQGTVTATANSPYTDLRIEGPASTLVTTSAANTPGVRIDAGAGTSYVSLDRIATSGSFSDGIVADSSDGTTVFVNNITTTGNNSEGIHAT